MMDMTVARDNVLEVAEMNGHAVEDVPAHDQTAMVAVLVHAVYAKQAVDYNDTAERDRVKLRYLYHHSFGAPGVLHIVVDGKKASLNELDGYRHSWRELEVAAAVRFHPLDSVMVGRDSQDVHREKTVGPNVCVK